MGPRATRATHAPCAFPVGSAHTAIVPVPSPRSKQGRVRSRLLPDCWLLPSIPGIPNLNWALHSRSPAHQPRPRETTRCSVGIMACKPNAFRHELHAVPGISCSIPSSAYSTTCGMQCLLLNLPARPPASLFKATGVLLSTGTYAAAGQQIFITIISHPSTCPSPHRRQAKRRQPNATFRGGAKS